MDPLQPLGPEALAHFVPYAEWRDVARQAEDDPTTEIRPGLTLRDAIISIPGRFGLIRAKAVDVEARTVDFVVSGPDRDRQGDTVNPKGWKLQNYRRNPVVLWGHDYYSLPVARAAKIGMDGEELVATDEFAPAEMYGFADTVFRMVIGRFLNAVSAGFRPIKWVWNDDEHGYDFAEQELYEHSVVPVPAYPGALRRAVKAGIDIGPLREWAERALEQIHGERGLWLPEAHVAGFLSDLKREGRMAPKGKKDGDAEPGAAPAPAPAAAPASAPASEPAAAPPPPPAEPAAPAAAPAEAQQAGITLTLHIPPGASAEQIAQIRAAGDRALQALQTAATPAAPAAPVLSPEEQEVEALLASLDAEPAAPAAPPAPAPEGLEQLTAEDVRSVAREALGPIVQDAVTSTIRALQGKVD